MARQTGLTDGPAREARFKRPRGIAIDGADNLFVADTGNGLIRRITPAGVVSTLAGAGMDGSAVGGPLRLWSPVDIVCTSDGTLYVIDAARPGPAPRGQVIRKIAPDGNVSLMAGREDGDDGAAAID
jgi:sugar lactone lactonase YvrE